MKAIMKKLLAMVAALLLLCMPLLATAETLIHPVDIAIYLYLYGELPENFITKAEAKALGWDSRTNYVSDVAPGKSIGGDYFGNYEGLLPKSQWNEADCWYEGGPRNAYRLIYSLTDNLYFYTDDHYTTFTEIIPEEVFLYEEETPDPFATPEPTAKRR